MEQVAKLSILSKNFKVTTESTSENMVVSTPLIFLVAPQECFYFSQRRPKFQ